MIHSFCMDYTLEVNITLAPLQLSPKFKNLTSQLYVLYSKQFSLSLRIPEENSLDQCNFMIRHFIRRMSSTGPTNQIASK